jgi:hypothetical protein
MSPGSELSRRMLPLHCQLRPLRVAKLVIIVVQTSLRSGV